ncbi:hypothetical protein [Sorangium sp. So ce388]|uniref:hypothetical protein n=1 Tax=Sorangium sp. So ce388 TaxID=3133309 RepID=UPI003F5BC8A3
MARICPDRWKREVRLRDIAVLGSPALPPTEPSLPITSSADAIAWIHTRHRRALQAWAAAALVPIEERLAASSPRTLRSGASP